MPAHRSTSSTPYTLPLPPQVPSHDSGFHQVGQRASFLPAFNVFPSSATSRSRQHTSEGLSDFALASPGSYSRSPVSSMRNSAPEQLASTADPEKKSVASGASSAHGSTSSGGGGSNSASPKTNSRPFGVRHHLPIVAALAEAGSKTPPRLSAAHARSRSNQHFGTPARGNGIALGISPGWNSWGDNYVDLAAELETFGGEGAGINVSPHSRSYAAW